MASPPKPPQSLWSRFQQIWTVATWLSLLLSVITLGLQGALVSWLLDKIGPAVSIWEVLAATAPLTISLVILGRGLLHGAFNSPITFLATAVFVLCLSAWIAARCGIHEVTQRDWDEILQRVTDMSKDHRPANIIAVLSTALDGVLSLYWRLYGAQKFFSSLFVGAFLIWVWEVLEPPAPAASIGPTTRPT